MAVGTCEGYVLTALENMFDQPGNDNAILEQVINAYGTESPQYKTILVVLQDGNFSTTRVAHGINAALSVAMPEITAGCAATPSSALAAPPVAPAANLSSPVSSVSPSASLSSSPSAAASSAIPPVPTTASGCTSEPSVVASPIANFPLLPAGVDPALKTEPVVTILAGPVPTNTEVKDIVVGAGATVGSQDSVTVNYLGLNYVDCTEFDSSWSRDEPATFSLDGVVPGFSKGVGGDSASGISPMKVGGRREIIVTPADGYGASGSGSIKPNEELVFVVDVLAASTP